MKTNVKIRTDKRKPIKNDIWMKKVWHVGEPQVSANGVPGWRGRFRPLNIFVEDIFGKDSKQSLKNVPKVVSYYTLTPEGD